MEEAEGSEGGGGVRQGYSLPTKSQVLHRVRPLVKRLDDTAVTVMPKVYTIIVRFPSAAEAEQGFRLLEKRAAAFFSAPHVRPASDACSLQTAGLASPSRVLAAFVFLSLSLPLACARPWPCSPSNGSVGCNIPC